MALDSARIKPLSSSTGVRPLGLIFKKFGGAAFAF